MKRLLAIGSCMLYIFLYTQYNGIQAHVTGKILGTSAGMGKNWGRIFLS